MSASPTSVHGHAAGPGRLRVLAPRVWTVWRRPRHVIGYILGVDLSAIALTVAALLVLPIRRTDLTLGFTILALAAIYIEASRHIERIRERSSTGPHIDLNSTWTFAAALLIHPALVTVTVATVYLHRWIRVRHHVVHRQTFSAAVTVIASYAGAGMLVLAGYRHGFAAMPRNLPAFVIVAAAGLTVVVINLVMVFIAIAMTQPRSALRTIASGWEDYILELATIGLAVLVAWALVDWPAAAAIIFGLAIVLHGKVLYPQLRQAARTDAKTGLLNHSAWSTIAKEELARAQATGQTVAVLMVDLDHFKLVNDVYGHPFGDEVLLHVAMAISGELRGSDLVGRADVAGRFGGEEFVVLLPGASMDGAVTVAERIRQHVAGLALITDDPADPDGADECGHTVNVTTSIGVAIHPTHGTALDDLIKAADRAVYAAKRAGRNKVRRPPVHTT